MAENLSIKKSPIDSVLECPLCLNQLKLPQTLLHCLHSYCKSCLDKVPQKTQDGRLGWLCPMCENFTKCDQVQLNTFIEELQKMHCEPEKCDKVKCQQCSEDCGQATWKCAECKIGLCDSAKIAHLRIPMLADHQVLPLDNDGEKVIDNVVFCKVHECIPAQLNCYDCDQLICSTCNTTDHQRHAVETVDQALERILPETQSMARKVNDNISIIEAQINSVKKEIEQTKEKYASCRMQIDEHLEKVICRMKAMKAQMEEDVNEQESIALDTLKELKQKLEKQLSQASILNNLTAVVTTKTKHTSQLQQLQNGLFEKAKLAGDIKKQSICFKLSTPDFAEGESFQEEIDKVFGKLVFDINKQTINIAGDSYSKPNQFICSDLNKLAETKYKKDKEIVVNVSWCNRLSYIDYQIWLPLDKSNNIIIYDEDGELIKVIDTGGKSITVVKEAHNGDIICAGASALFVTDKQFSKWTQLSEGKFCDIAVSKDKIIALQYNCPRVYTYSYVKDVYTGQESSWRESHSFMLNKDMKVDSLSSICISGEQYIFIALLRAKSLYKLTRGGEALNECKVLPFYPVICGTDEHDNILVSDFKKGTMYLFEPLSEKEIPRILSSVQTPGTRSVVIDQNNDLWVLAGIKGDGFKLIKFASQE